MSQPPAPGVPPSFQPPPNYGGYSGELQSFGQPPVPTAPPPWASNPMPPAPSYAHPTAPAATLPGQRPAVVAMAATLAVTASLQWICGLSFLWLVATAGARELGTTGVDGGVYHLLNRFHYRMLDGLAWPLYLFPAVSFVLAFLLLARRQWARLAFTLTGAAAVGWLAWFVRSDLVWWVAPALYISVAVGILWTPAAHRWYGWQPERQGP
ncbi:MAG: hypothetical protein H0T91_04210 [Propionibacteriaceae bacterium]|nr:hypothetical protein [Propionibacteriaceae bacterium]